MKTEQTTEWTKCAKTMPPEKQEVMTKIDDENGCRNERSLTFAHNLWWFPGMTMYVYYRPTHWRKL